MKPYLVIIIFPSMSLLSIFIHTSTLCFTYPGPAHDDGDESGVGHPGDAPRTRAPPAGPHTHYQMFFVSRIFAN